MENLYTYIYNIECINILRRLFDNLLTIKIVFQHKMFHIQFLFLFILVVSLSVIHIFISIIYFIYIFVYSSLFHYIIIHIGQLIFIIYKE